MPHKRTIPHVCEHCGTHFLATTDVPGKYCSKACHYQALRDRYINCSCVTCGAEFFVRPKLVASGRKYCSQACAVIGNAKHGFAKRVDPLTPEYVAWSNMNARCRNPNTPNYALYGGRGITVCESWQHSFDAFLAYMGPRPAAGYSLDRINNDGNYAPGNVRWATKTEQMNNRRVSKMLTWNGTTQSLTDWAHTIGVNRDSLTARLRYGWSIERALTTPVEVRQHHK